MSDIYLRSNYLAEFQETYLLRWWYVVAPHTGPLDTQQTPDFFNLFVAGANLLSALHAIGPIPGKPDDVRGLGAHLAEFAQDMRGVHGNLADAASTYLPSVWVGAAANSANDVLSAMAHDTSRWADWVQPCKGLLETLADNLATAQQNYNLAWQDVESGHSDLHDPPTWEAVKGSLKQMIQALQRMIDAASAAENAGQDAAHAIASQTLPLHKDDMDPSVDSTYTLAASDWLVMTDEAMSGGDPFGAMNDVQSGTTRLAQLSPDDSATFNTLLVRADTPAEKARLLAELGRGTPVDKIADAVYPFAGLQARQRDR